MTHPRSTRRPSSDGGDSEGARLDPVGEDALGRDAAWMRRIAAGDREAFRALYEHHAPRLLRFLWRLCGDRQAAEDWLQDVFLKVWHAARRFDPERPLGPWLYSIARRHAWQRLARRHRRKAVWRQALDGRPEAPGSPSHSSPSQRAAGRTANQQDNRMRHAQTHEAQTQDAASQHQRLEQEELAAHLDAALARLAPRLRLVFVLVRMEQLSLAAAAEVAGVPVGTVKSRLVAAERRLRRLLGPHLS